MPAKAPILMLASAMLGFGTPVFGQYALPDPKIFARAEDQARARLLSKPCTETDVGVACYRHDGRLIREAPCAYHIDAGTIGSLPTDQCFKMQAPRRFRGVWINQFEGQEFTPEGTSPPKWPRTDAQAPNSKEQFERARLAAIWIDASRAKLDGKPRSQGARWFIEL